MTAHRYWRINITSNGFGSIADIAELSLASSVGGANLIGSGTITASSIYSGSYAASYAVDGNPSTSWSAASGSGFPQWLTYDFGVGNSYSIVEVKITARNDAIPNTAPSTFDLLYSDDNTIWIVSQSFTASPWSLGQTQTFDVVTYFNPSSPYFLADRIKETTSTSGTGSIALNGATDPNTQTFSSGIGTGNSTYYCIQTINGWEVGQGTVGGSGPYTLTRNLIASSTGSLLSLSGTNTVYCTTIAKSLQSAIKTPWSLYPPMPDLSSLNIVGMSNTTNIRQSPINNSITITDLGTNNIILCGCYTPAPTPPYRVIIMGQHTGISSNYQGISVAFTNGTSYRSLTVWNLLTTEIDGFSPYNSRTTYAGGNNIFGQNGTYWFGLRDDGTNVYMEFSNDSVNFVTIFSEAKSSGYLGSSGYSNIWFGVCPSSPTSYYATFRSYNTNGLTKTF
jgi:hypothetical protein